MKRRWVIQGWIIGNVFFFKGGFFKVDYWKWISLRSVFLQGWIFLIGGGVDFL